MSWKLQGVDHQLPRRYLSILLIEYGPKALEHRPGAPRRIVHIVIIRYGLKAYRSRPGAPNMLSDNIPDLIYIYI